MTYKSKRMHSHPNARKKSYRRVRLIRRHLGEVRSCTHLCTKHRINDRTFRTWIARFPVGDVKALANQRGFLNSQPQTPDLVQSEKVAMRGTLDEQALIELIIDGN